MIRAIVFDFYYTLVYRDMAQTARTRETIAGLFGVTAADLNSLWRRDRDARMLGEIATLEEHLTRILAELGALVDERSLAEAARLEREGQRLAVHSYANTERVLGALRQMGFRL
ncbi:MAG: HAD family hydrolase, partial [Chloroflexota bacterium]